MNRPGPPGLEALAADLNSAAVHLLRAIRRTDDTLGLTPARLSALSVLVYGGPRTVRELADAEQVAGPTMSRLVGWLAEHGMATRAGHPADGRAVLVSATPRGVDVLERGRMLRVRTLAARLAALDPTAVDTLAAAVPHLRALASD